MTQKDPKTEYTPGSLVTDFLTSPNRVKLLDLLIQNDDDKLTIKEMCELTNISEAEIQMHMDRLTNKNMIIEQNNKEKTSEFNTNTYQINTENVTVKTLQKLQKTLPTTDQ